MRTPEQHEELIDDLIGELTQERLSALVISRARKKAHAAARLLQPDVQVAIHDHDWARLVADFKRPISEVERQSTGLDLLLQTVKDCMRSGSREDTLFAALRVVRWCWAHFPSQHCEPIES